MDVVNDIVYILFTAKFMMYWPTMRFDPQPKFTRAMTTLMIGSVLCRLYTDFHFLALLLSVYGLVLFHIQCHVWMQYIIGKSKHQI